MKLTDFLYNLSGLCLMLFGIWLALSLDWPQPEAPEPDDEDDDGYGEDEYFWRTPVDGEIEPVRGEMRL